MLGLRLRATPARAFTTSAFRSVKVPVALIAQLRKAHPVPMAQAREALEKSNLDVDAAITYLTSATGASAQKKADKVSGRETSEGAIAVSVLGGRRVGMVHLACETDFVARNDVFRNVAKGIAETAAFLDIPGTEEMPAPVKGSDPIKEFPVDQLVAAPLISLVEGEANKESQSIAQLVVASVSQTGENLQLRRAVSFAAPFPAQAGRRIVPGAYTHGGDESTGKIGGIVILDVGAIGETPVGVLLHKKPELEEQLNALARNLARQIVGFPTKALSPGDGVAEEEALLTQPFMMGGSDKPVAEAVKAWGEERGLEVEIMALRRWSTSDEL
ncbi:hypothetical protein CspHIS471_0211600 [Cutaneotrichosporon sp. HIS471]|nr:hypothetical protein CspHIS471_0211600 [Cutaneotrichosporon sp. HIS471]